MATKEQQRAELHATIWKIANDLRGSVDGWDFKAYVLGILFYRFISENLTDFINATERVKNPTFNYAEFSDDRAEAARSYLVKIKGFFILPSELFCNVTKNAENNENLNLTLEAVFKNIEKSAKGTGSESDLAGLFSDIDVNSNKLGATTQDRNKHLTKILQAVADFRVGNLSDQNIDTFGDAYEFLMSMYASNAGKSGGEFFTPQEVSELLARLAVVGKTSVNKVYDPCCGSGSLLLKFVKVLGEKGVREGFFGQEINITTYNLCRINMFLHGVNFDRFDIEHGDTLLKPQHWDETPFDVIVSNPPYSVKWEGDSNPLMINDPRFSPAGVLAPKGKADLAFTMHMLSWLSGTGTACIVEFPGVLYRGGAEEQIRKHLISNNYVDTVIQLPPDLFFGTTIATCILVLKKAKSTSDILFIDASKEFVREGNKNKLKDANIQKILQTHIKREEVEHFSKVVSNDDVIANDSNLSISAYVEPENTEEVVDIKVLNAKIADIVKREAELRAAIDSIIADLEA